MKQVAMKPVNPTVPTMKCIKPCQLIGLFSSGVPGGKPSAGSALKIPAPINPKPYSASMRGDMLFRFAEIFQSHSCRT